MLELNIIGIYFKATRGRGLVLNPPSELKIHFCADADFSGIYGGENSTDTALVKSITGYAITVYNSPVLLKSKLQIKTALSTMGVDIIAMAHRCKELFTIMDLVYLLRQPFGMHVVYLT